MNNRGFNKKQNNAQVLKWRNAIKSGALREILSLIDNSATPAIDNDLESLEAYDYNMRGDKVKNYSLALGLAVQENNPVLFKTLFLAGLDQEGRLKFLPKYVIDAVVVKKHLEWLNLLFDCRKKLSTKISELNVLSDKSNNFGISVLVSIAETHGDVNLTNFCINRETVLHQDMLICLKVAWDNGHQLLANYILAKADLTKEEVEGLAEFSLKNYNVLAFNGLLQKEAEMNKEIKNWQNFSFFSPEFVVNFLEASNCDLKKSVKDGAREAARKKFEASIIENSNYFSDDRLKKIMSLCLNKDIEDGAVFVLNRMAKNYMLFPGSEVLVYAARKKSEKFIVALIERYGSEKFDRVLEEFIGVRNGEHEISSFLTGVSLAYQKKLLVLTNPEVLTAKSFELNKPKRPGRI